MELGNTSYGDHSVVKDQALFYIILDSYNHNSLTGT